MSAADPLCASLRTCISLARIMRMRRRVRAYMHEYMRVHICEYMRVYTCIACARVI